MTAGTTNTRIIETRAIDNEEISRNFIYRIVSVRLHIRMIIF